MSTIAGNPTVSSTKTFFLSKYAGEVPLLNESNYAVWSNLMKMHLDSIDALDIVTGATPKPNSETNTIEYEIWRRSEAKAKAAINGACTLGIRGYILDCTSSAEMWNRLKDRLDIASSAKGRQLLKRKFLTTKPENGKPIGNFIAKLENLRFQLLGTPQEIDDETFKDQILCCLPDDFQNIVDIINEKDDTLSSADVINKIQQAEIAKNNRKALSANSSTVSEQALFTRGSFRGRGRGNYRGTGRERSSFRANPYISNGNFPGACNKCGVKGHKAFQCTSGSDMRKSNLSSSIECFGCGEIGHGTKACPYQNKTEEQNRKGSESYTRWIQNQHSIGINKGDQKPY